MFDDLKIIPKILFDPVNFFSKLKEQSIGELYKFWVQLSLVNVLIGFVVSLLNVKAWMEIVERLADIIGPISPLLSTSGVFLFNVIFTIISFFLMITLGFVFIIIISFILHIFVYIFGGRGFEKTLTAVVIGMTPTAILGQIPLVGIFAGLYGLILEIVGVSELHKFSIIRSIAVVLIPLIILGLIIGALIAATALLYLSSINSINELTSSTISIIDASCINGKITLIISNTGTSDIADGGIKVFIDGSLSDDYGTLDPINSQSNKVAVGITSYDSGKHIVTVTSSSNSEDRIVYCD